jgi:hypothetical protein
LTTKNAIWGKMPNIVRVYHKTPDIDGETPDIECSRYCKFQYGDFPLLQPDIAAIPGDLAAIPGL